MGRFLYIVYDWTDRDIKTVSYNRDKAYAKVGEDYLEGGDVEDCHVIEIDLEDKNLLQEMKEWEKALIVAGLKILMGGRMTSEEVAKAIDWLETGDFEIIAGDEEYLANSSHHPNTLRFRQTAITALQALNEWNLRRL